MASASRGKCRTLACEPQSSINLIVASMATGGSLRSFLGHLLEPKVAPGLLILMILHSNTLAIMRVQLICPGSADANAPISHAGSSC